MSARKPAPDKRYFTVAEANAMLPLVRSIVRDITTLAHDLRERHKHIGKLREPADRGSLGQAYREEIEQLETSFEADQQRLQEFVRELARLGVELKDYFTGLVDFPARREGREVYLCWKHGEEEVAHWHELDAGFAGRQKLTAEAPRR
jgi:hypothetical protein